MIDWNAYRTIGIFGNVGSGKTALAYKILEEMGNSRQIYFIKHPKPELIESFGYRNLCSLDAITGLMDAVIYWDEPQLTLEVPEYKRDTIIARILSLARQRNITLIVSSSDTRTFGKRVEAYFDLWLVKDVEYEMTKQRSQIRQVLKANSFITPEEIHLEKNEFLLHNRRDLSLNGKHAFELIDNWTDELSKPYGNSPKTHEKLVKNSQNSEKTDKKNSQKIECEAVLQASNPPPVREGYIPNRR